MSEQAFRSAVGTHEGGPAWEAEASRSAAVNGAREASGEAWTRLVLHRAAVLTAGFLLATLLISFEFWMPDRLYPLVPLTGIPLPDFAAKAALLALVLALVLFVLRPALPMRYLMLPCALLLLLIAEDQSRMQPYIFMYLLTLIVCAATMRASTPQALLDSLRLLCAGAYFWSGVQKMNFEFLNTIFPWFMSPLQAVLPAFAFDIVMQAGLFVPVFEAMIGVLLIISPVKAIPLGMAAVMLGTVLFCLGPLGHDWNIIVWPWNIWLFTMSLWLFGQRGLPPMRLFEFRAHAPYVVKALVFVAIGILPMLGMANYWDGYMSFKLYSGNTYQATVSLPDGDAEKLPAELAAFAEGRSLSLTTASFGLYEVAPYPERRIFLSVWRQWCEAYGLNNSVMWITSQTRFYGRRDRTEEFSCPPEA